MNKNIEDDYREELGKAIFKFLLKLLIIPLVLTVIFIITALLDTAIETKNSTNNDDALQSSYISISGDIADDDVILVVPETNDEN